MFFFFFKQKTAYEMRISDWSSDVCSSDLSVFSMTCWSAAEPTNPEAPVRKRVLLMGRGLLSHGDGLLITLGHLGCGHDGNVFDLAGTDYRSEEHTSELQSLMRTSYAVFCLNNQTTHAHNISTSTVYL